MHERTPRPREYRSYPKPDRQRSPGAIQRLAAIALDAVEAETEHAAPAGLRRHPGTLHPGRVVTHVLEVSAAQLGNPVLFLVLVKADDRLSQSEHLLEDLAQHDRLIVLGVPGAVEQHQLA